MPLRLSEKHGVNPTIPSCFWCEKKKNEVVLMGRLRDDVEAPRTIVLDYDPCDSCEKAMAMGISLIECAEKPMIEGHREIQQGLYPTGRWFVVSQDFVLRIFDDEMAQSAVNHRKAFIDKECIEMLGLDKAEATHKLEDLSD